MTTNTEISRLFCAPVAVAIAGEPDFEVPPFPGECAGSGYVAPKRRREFAAGRHSARNALAMLGHPRCALPRKPDGTVAWPAGICGSITHCERLCAAAVTHVARIEAIGLDAEPRKPMTPEVADSILSAQERAFRQSLPEELKSLWPLIAFSAKEAFYKCHHPFVGVDLAFEDVAILIDGPIALPTGRFAIMLRRPDLPLADRSADFIGRYLVTDDLVVTAVTLPAHDARR